MAKAALRVVRLLDEPEPQTFPIVKGIPIPKRRREGKFVRTMRSMGVGDSFIVTSLNHVYIHAKTAGIEITARRAPGGVWRIWRTA